MLEHHARLLFPLVAQSFGPCLTFLLLEIIKIEQFYINVYISVDFQYLATSVVLFYLFMPFFKPWPQWILKFEFRTPDSFIVYFHFLLGT